MNVYFKNSHFLGSVVHLWNFKVWYLRNFKRFENPCARVCLLFMFLERESRNRQWRRWWMLTATGGIVCSKRHMQRKTYSGSEESEQMENDPKIQSSSSSSSSEQPAVCKNSNGINVLPVAGRPTWLLGCERNSKLNFIVILENLLKWCEINNKLY